MTAILADGAAMDALVERAQHGDTVAMNDLLDALAPWVGRICGSIALEQGEDATQEALVTVFRRLGSLRDSRALRGWVRAIAVREAVRIAKTNAGSRTATLIDLPARGDAELASDLRDVLMRLSPEHRAVLVLRYVEGLDEARAAELLRIPKGTVKSRLSRARESFRKAWTR
jgi:RNA polymerase sigma-70 factor (ECF subfamily)